MKERFIEKLDKFMRRVLEVPPTFEELSVNFPHGEGCSRSQLLRQIEKEEVVDSDGLGGGWVIGSFVRVTRRYLECDDCHIRARFVG